VAGLRDETQDEVKDEQSVKLLNFCEVEKGHSHAIFLPTSSVEVIFAG
jgi:hypothetical protein